MKVVLFAHPQFLGSTSMPLFADMLAKGLLENGHAVERWTPSARFHRLPAPQAAKKWLGYLDQYLLFPIQVRWRLRLMPADTLYVFADQALGPWVPLVSGRPHVVHCHDFLALRSALGEISRNPVSWTGRLYQRWIRRGFRSGRNFISVSARTRDDLCRYLAPWRPDISTVVHNGLNRDFEPIEEGAARQRLEALGLDYPEPGFVLHVGGNQWYKNREGVLAIYSAYAQQVADPLPLFLLGAEPTRGLRELAAEIPSPGRVEFVVRPSGEDLEAAYSAAAVLLFPSYAEGFGWPIVEAMACGCPVLTTGDAPMTEVGGDVAHYLPAQEGADRASWAKGGAQRLLEILAFGRARRNEGIARARTFDAGVAMDGYLSVYEQVLTGEAKLSGSAENPALCQGRTGDAGFEEAP